MILVTGATGFLGAHLTYALLKAGERVKALKRTKSSIQGILHIFSFYEKEPTILFKNIEWIDADIYNYYDVMTTCENVDQVYHAAATVDFGARGKQQLMQTNIEGTRNIVNACLEQQVKKLCFVSSIAALDDTTDPEHITENSFLQDLKNKSTYSKSKYIAETEVWRGIAEGLNAVIVNPGAIIGTGNWHEGSPSIIKRASKGIPYYPSGSTGFIDVRDVVTVMMQLMNSDISAERFILVSENLSYKIFLEIAADALGTQKPKKEMPAWMLGLAWRLSSITSLFGATITKDMAHILQTHLSYSNEKLKQALAFEFISMQKSIADTVAHFKNDQQHIQQ